MGEEPMAQTGMPRPAGSDQTLGELVAQATKDVSQLIRGELNLAKAELRIDARRIGLAVGLLAMAAFISCLVLVMLCFALAYGLQAFGIWAWASFLIVAGACVVVIGLAALIAVLRVRGVTGLSATRSSVQDTMEVLRGGDRRPEIAGPAQQ
jgi:uncharacterized membrane protein YqjE